MDLTHKDVQNILKIIDEAEHLEEIELVYGNIKLHVRRHGSGGDLVARPPAPENPRAPAPSVSTTAPKLSPPPVEEPVPEGTIAIRAPMLGTFYRSPAPGEKPFVEVGQRVSANDTVCLIEVMKLFNSIRAGVDGIVVKILCENAALVEYNQVMVLVEPQGRKR